MAPEKCFRAAVKFSFWGDGSICAAGLNLVLITMPGTAILVSSKPDQNSR